MLQPPIPPRNLLPDLTGSPNSSDSVARAIEAYRADRWTYDRAAQGDIPDKFDTLPAVIAILDAAMARSDSLLLPLANEVVSYRTNRPQVEAISTLGEALIRAALAREQSDPDTAAGYYNAVLALGAKMCRERLVYAEMQAGWALMGEASQRLAKLTHSRRRADLLQRFAEAQRDFTEQKLVPVWRVLGSVDPSTVAVHAGDALIIARRSPERLWRTEAVFALGRYQYSAPRPADAALARRSLKEIAESDEDPFVRQAARTASAMTIEDFRMLH